MASAHHLGTQPVDNQTGGGLVDAYQAIMTVAPMAGGEAVVIPASDRR